MSAPTEHLPLYALTDTRFTFPLDPERRAWTVEDIVRFALVRFAQEDPAATYVEIDEIVAIITGALADGTLAPAVCLN